ncbi:pectate lyase family protein [Niveispirillum sp. KHB5.9]|uniref:pectate lyase family protein n=1 Tax=Niveispirillum sp. KHB5.9 TaxID=3400269 RepID=UPI003A8B23B0
MSMRHHLLPALTGLLILAPGPAGAVGRDVAPAAIPAFPGAEGAGAHAMGGRAGRVFIVSSLEDEGPGTLREAVTAKGPRTVVFAVSGTIGLKSNLNIKNDFITIAGQTAPGGGITLRDYPLVVAANHVVIRHVRARLGSASGQEADAVSIYDGKHIILDHVSASWSTDESLSVSQKYKDGLIGLDQVTVQWSVIAESLNKSVHAKGDHGYGSLVRGSFGARYSFHHNLWASHTARMPRPGNFEGQKDDPTGPFIDFRNNVFFNWKGSGKQGASGYNADADAVSAYNFVNNYYVSGPDSKGAKAFDEKSPVARAFFAGNWMNHAEPADPWSLVTGEQAEGYRQTAPIPMAPVKTEAADAAYRAVMARAGAGPVRDAVDERVIAGLAKGEGKIIDSQDDVGGWPVLASSPAPVDADRDGMPDAWEKAHGLNPADPADGARDANGDGYTNLEEYLNGL